MDFLRKALDISDAAPSSPSARAAAPASSGSPQKAAATSPQKVSLGEECMLRPFATPSLLMTTMCREERSAILADDYAETECMPLCAQLQRSTPRRWTS